MSDATIPPGADDKTGLAAAAEEALDLAIGASTQNEIVPVNLAAAQVYATLAVAEAVHRLADLLDGDGTPRLIQP